ncbi:Hypothetical protein PHPALM_892 [Phytophthora palmivora]|uniref:Uncharacterized protein n=1 Tax=Phytophthora palmivora TaxID=4796 RepID=A0A2P4YTT9_9STRA|nr:Hypothetical protein PHPALM_892 [Phytophthora palmivora]
MRYNHCLLIIIVLILTNSNFIDSGANINAWTVTLHLYIESLDPYIGEFMVLPVPEDQDILLGMPWLKTVNPNIDWNWIEETVKPHQKYSDRQQNTTQGKHLGLAPYLQAGDIAIYKTFKVLLSIEINTWKESGKVEYTRFGNPRMPSVTVVCECNCQQLHHDCWDYMEWHVVQHDVYDEKFCGKWGDADAIQEVSVTSSNLGVTYSKIRNLLEI